MKRLFSWPSIALLSLVLAGTIVAKVNEVDPARNEYAASGSNTFPYTFKVLDASHLEVIVGGTATTAFSVTGVGNASGGNVVLNTTPVIGTQVVILRKVPLDQQTGYIEGGKFPASLTETALDKLTTVDQRLNERIDRALKLPKTSSNSNLTVPDPDSGKIMQWKADLSGLQNVALPTTSTPVGTLTQVTEAQRLALSPSEGDLVQQTDSKTGVWQFLNGIWVHLANDDGIVTVLDGGAVPLDRATVNTNLFGLAQCTASDATLTFYEPHGITSAHVGLPIMVDKCGSGAGDQLLTTIAAVNDATSIEMGTTATKTINPASVNFTNGDCSSPLATGWTDKSFGGGSAACVSNQFNLTGNGAGGVGWIQQALTLTEGLVYRLEVRFISSSSTHELGIRIGTCDGCANLQFEGDMKIAPHGKMLEENAMCKFDGVDKMTCLFSAGDGGTAGVGEESTTTYIGFRNPGNFTIIIDDLNVDPAGSAVNWGNKQDTGFQAAIDLVDNNNGQMKIIRVPMTPTGGDYVIDSVHMVGQRGGGDDDNITWICDPGTRIVSRADTTDFSMLDVAHVDNVHFKGCTFVGNNTNRCEENNQCNVTNRKHGIAGTGNNVSIDNVTFYNIYRNTAFGGGSDGVDPIHAQDWRVHNSQFIGCGVYGPVMTSQSGFKVDGVYADDCSVGTEQNNNTDFDSRASFDNIYMTSRINQADRHLLACGGRSDTPFAKNSVNRCSNFNVTGVRVAFRGGGFSGLGPGIISRVCSINNNRPPLDLIGNSSIEMGVMVDHVLVDGTCYDGDANDRRGLVGSTGGAFNININDSVLLNFRGISRDGTTNRGGIGFSADSPTNVAISNTLISNMGDACISAGFGSPGSDGMILTGNVMRKCNQNASSTSGMVKTSQGGGYHQRLMVSNNLFDATSQTAGVIMDFDVASSVTRSMYWDTSNVIKNPNTLGLFSPDTDMRIGELSAPGFTALVVNVADNSVPSSPASLLTYQPFDNIPFYPEGGFAMPLYILVQTDDPDGVDFAMAAPTATVVGNPVRVCAWDSNSIVVTLKNQTSMQMEAGIDRPLRPWVANGAMGCADFVASRDLNNGINATKWSEVAPNPGLLYLGEITANPTTAFMLPQNGMVTMYTKNNKLVWAYNNAGTATYVTLDLNGSDTTLSHGTTAP